MNEALAQETHDEVWMLLPWYVNRTLEDEDLKLVNQHLKVCISCRSELETQKKLCERVSESVTEDVCQQIQFKHLMQKIHSQPQHEKLVNQAQNSRFGFRIAGLAAAVLLTLMLMFTGMSEQADSSYKTLSNPVIVSDAQINDIRVIFESYLDENQRQALLIETKAELISQPDSHGVYILRIEGAEEFSHSEIRQVIGQLRQRKEIIFAEPVPISGT